MVINFAVKHFIEGAFRNYLTQAVVQGKKANNAVPTFPCMFSFQTLLLIVSNPFNESEISLLGIQDEADHKLYPQQYTGDGGFEQV